MSPLATPESTASCSKLDSLAREIGRAIEVSLEERELAESACNRSRLRVRADFPCERESFLEAESGALEPTAITVDVSQRHERPCPELVLS